MIHSFERFLEIPAVPRMRDFLIFTARAKPTISSLFELQEQTIRDKY